MKLLGDDCWWAPAWMKRIQERLGRGEPILDDDRMQADIPDLARTPQFHAGDPMTEPFRRVSAQPSRVRTEPRSRRNRSSEGGSPISVAELLARNNHSWAPERRG
ncbi:hypothetical protein, partial [Rhodococcus sp. NPDC059234]|uniref:hypothetical protein n=1 Tax=Rhodococcus sp. NPDC059234 TaxID=3346781 RepID=UPI00367196C2